MYQLSAGSCQRLHDTVSSDDPILNQPHILQILSIKGLNPTASANSVGRYRTVMSDGVHYILAMLATRLNRYVQEQQIQKHSVIFVEKMDWHQLGGKCLSIVLSLRVLGSPYNTIGDPKKISPEGTISNTNSTVASMTPGFDGLANKPFVKQQNQMNQNPPLSARNPRTNSTYPMGALGSYVIKNWSNQKGEGGLFNATLMDASGEIKATNIISPYSCLNEDVLREIFIRCVSDHGNGSKYFILDDCKPSISDYAQFSVSRVCSSWRHVALLTPQLWNNVMIQCLTESNLSIARKYLEHAQNLPISIILGPYIAVQDWHLQLTDFLSSYRLRRIIIRAMIPRFHAILRDLPRRSVEDLELLEIFYDHNPEEATIDLNDIRYPKLTSVDISGAYKISGCSSSLRVFDGTGLLMTVIESWDLLSRCPSLEEARVRMMPDDVSRKQLPEPRIYRQCLRKLILESEYGAEIPFSIFIAALALPSLETMHVSNARVAWSVTAFQSLAQRSNHFPNLSDFLLSNATSDVDAGTLLASMPHVTRVYLMCHPFKAVFDQRALNGLASGSLAPRLQYLMGSISYGKEFMGMMESRMRNAQVSSNGVPAPFTKVAAGNYCYDI
ncbi:hypothetical protein JOM56_001825 [Amanita muscaria]